MTEYCDFHERNFKRKVENALDSVRRVLDVDRGSKVHIAGEVDHQYSDKYKLADMLTNTTIVAVLDVLKELGLTKEVIRSIDKSKETTLRFSLSESCKFVKTEVVENPMPYSKETQETTTNIDEFGTSESTTTKSTIEKIVERVTKDHYELGMEWELSIYSGTDVNNRKILKERKVSSCPHVTNRPSYIEEEAVPPFPSQREFSHKELSLTWLLQQIDAVELKSHFSIDTSTDNTQTKTPSRNSQIKGATSFFRSLLEWAQNMYHYRLSESAWSGGIEELLANPEEWDIFVPIIPLLEDPTPNATQIQSKIESESGSESWVDDKDEDSMGIEAESKPMPIESESKAMASLPLTNPVNDSGDTLSTRSPMLSVVDMMSFLHEHARALGEKKQKLKETFSERQGQLISWEEAMLIIFSMHSVALVQQFLDSIKYIENLLEQQLVSAIGKRVNSRDLEEFMNYHNEKLFNPPPKRFCYTIRRPGHYPDGILSIEKEVNHDKTSKVESISTHVREVALADPIKVPLNAATTLALTGNTYLHGWLKHQFGSSFNSFLSDSIRLNARARQFSSFVLVVGTMTNQNHLQPKNAIILRNKDEIHIPLLLNEIPTATEFKNSISSLSPEQQQFAESFRSMQLDSSVLGVCIIQIKPQLEKLLGLPKDSLTKEMKLTEDLMELFVKYQVPSDLVSCDFPTTMDVEGHVESNHQSVKDQVANVREHANAVMDVIAAQKKEQLEEQEKKAEMAASTAFTEAPFGGEGAARHSRAPMPMSSAQERNRRAAQLRRKRRVAPSMSKYSAPSMHSIARSMCMLQGQGGAGEDDFAFDSMEQEETSQDQDASLDHVKENNISPSQKDTVVFAAMPKVLDKAIEFHDKNAAIRSTTIKTANSGWARIRQANLLSEAKKEVMEKDQIESEKSKAFDLLDALSRSGSLEIPFSELHVLICATHRFEKNVMETVIQDNINPIQKLEMSTLLMASTILGIPSRDLIQDKKNRQRLETSFPLLLGGPSNRSS